MRFKRKEGMALVLVIFVMVVLMIIGTTLITISLTEANNSFREENKLKAHYVAQAGLDAVAKYITNVNNPTSIVQNLINNTSITPLVGVIGEGSFRTTVTGDPTSTIKITSVGTVANITETQSLEMFSQINAADIFKNVVYSKQSMDLAGLTIKGPLQSVGTITHVPTYDSDGKLYTSTWDVNASTPMQTPQFIIPTLPSKTMTNNTISANGDYGTISVNNTVITFNTPSNGILSVVVDDFSSKSDIVINGTGKVYLYVKNTLTVQTPHTGGNLNLIVLLGTPQPNGTYSPSGTYNMQGNANFSGFIYGPAATINNNSHANFEGAIVCDAFSLSGTVNFVPIDYNVDLTNVIQSNLQKKIYSNN